jgi:hypothetical protein
MGRIAILVQHHSSELVRSGIIGFFASGNEMEMSNSATLRAGMHIENHPTDDAFAGLHDQRMCNLRISRGILHKPPLLPRCAAIGLTSLRPFGRHREESTHEQVA